MPKTHSAKGHGHHRPAIQASQHSGRRGLPTPKGTIPSYIPNRDSLLHGDRTLPDTEVKDLKNNILFLLIMKQKTNPCSLQTLVKEKSSSLLLIPSSDNPWLAETVSFPPQPVS